MAKAIEASCLAGRPTDQSSWSALWDLGAYIKLRSFVALLARHNTP